MALKGSPHPERKHSGQSPFETPLPCGGVSGDALTDIQPQLG
jgi:hypothetical protein